MAGSPDTRVGWRTRVGELLELIALSGIAVAEPVLTAFRAGADVFVLRRAEPLHVVVFTVAVVLGPPLLFWVTLQVAGAVAPSRRQLLRGSFLGLFAALFAARLVAGLGAPSRLLVAGAAVAVGVAVALALRRWPPVTTWLRVLGVFPLVLGVGFLTTDPVAALVTGEDPAGIDSVTVGRPDPVVMLVVDELPTASLLDEQDRISAEQFPNLAAFAEDATWYRNHTSVSPTTPQAVPALLTGSLPDSLDALPVAEEHPDNLFTLLGGSYRMHVREGATRLCPTDLCQTADAPDHPVMALLDDATALWSDQLASDEEERRGDFTVRQSDPNAPLTFQGFLAGIEADQGPRLDFHHTLYPHQPWFHLPSGQVYEAPFIAEGLEDPAYSWSSIEAADHGRLRHLLQARHADVLVGQLMRRLEELDRYDDSLVVVVSDHGVAFDPGQPIRGLGPDNGEQVMWTPLLIKAPGQTVGRLDERPVETIDVVPTIADHLEIDLPFPTDGTSLLRTAAEGDRSPDRRSFLDWSLNTVPADEAGVVTVDGEAGYAAMLALPAPGEGDDPDLRFYRFGRHGDLIGRRLSDLRLGPAVDGLARIDQLDALTAVDTTAATLPVYLSGEIPGDDPVDLAVAVNGTIGGWTRTVAAPTGGGQRFWTMVPPGLLVDGANAVSVAVIEGSGPDRRLHSVPVSGG